MSGRTVEVTTGSRLHFGLMSFGLSDVRQFGGVGAMIDSPGVRLRITDADDLVVAGSLADQVRRYAETVGQSEWLGRSLRCQIQVVAAPTPHVGLGSGTQMALAVAAGLGAFFDRPRLSAAELAATVGRGRRSAIGLYGFLHGGLIVEAGKLREELISPLVKSVTIPPTWRFLLVRPPAVEGLFGDAERLAFEGVTPVPREVTERMQRLSRDMAAAVAENRFGPFSQSLYEFGQQAGSCFSCLQGGIYASAHLAAVAETLRNLGVAGVVQSSWGPTVCAVLPSEQEAQAVLAKLPFQAGTRDAISTMVQPLNHGATIVVRDD